MLKTVKQLKEERGQKVKAQKDLLEKRKAEKRKFTTEEVSEFNGLDDEIKELDQEIDQRTKEEAAEARAAALAGNPVTTEPSEPEQRNLSNFSFVKAVKESSSRSGLSGLELEMHQEAEKEARDLGQSITGTGVPSLILGHNSEQRTTLTTGTAATAGDMVDTSRGSFIGALRDRLVLTGLGATFLSGLTDKLEFIKQNGVATFSWVAENATSGETNPSVTKIEMSPNRLTGTIPMSNLLILQTSGDIERLVRNDITVGIALAYEKAAINGSGTGNEPLGLLNRPGVSVVANGTNGDSLNWARIIQMETEVDQDNALLNSLGYLTNSKVRGILKSTEKFANTGKEIWQPGNEVNGYRAAVTNQVPSGLSKGTGNNLSAMAFGDWSSMYLGQWGGMDIITDNVTRKKEAITEVTVHMYGDVNCRHEESFSISKDIVTG
ncbi:MAG: phage major capsid protein [Roseivirga sp.]|nr:phage major capsid protein [Roseivirga sp.]